MPVILPPVVNNEDPIQGTPIDLAGCVVGAKSCRRDLHSRYSLPPEDLHARFTIRSAIRGNEKFEGHKLRIAVVNPERNVYLRFARLVEGNVKYYESGLQGVSLNELESGG